MLYLIFPHPILNVADVSRLSVITLADIAGESVAPELGGRHAKKPSSMLGTCSGIVTAPTWKPSWATAGKDCFNSEGA